jgi:hypothetical protein
MQALLEADRLRLIRGGRMGKIDRIALVDYDMFLLVVVEERILRCSLNAVWISVKNGIRVL